MTSPQPQLRQQLLSDSQRENYEEEGSKRVKAVVWGSQESQHQIIDPWEVMLVQAGVIQESYVQILMVQEVRAVQVEVEGVWF